MLENATALEGYTLLSISPQACHYRHPREQYTPLAEKALEAGLVPLSIQGEINDCSADGALMAFNDTLLKHRGSARGVALLIDSPGGEVSAAERIRDAVLNSGLPSYTYVMGDALSAAYWVASLSDSIHCRGPLCRVGGVGAFIRLADPAGLFEAQGIKIHDIYATRSTQKNLALREAMKGDYERLRTTRLDPLVETLVTDVLARTPNPHPAYVQRITSGDDMSAAEALGYHAISGIGNFNLLLETLNATPKQENQPMQNIPAPKSGEESPMNSTPLAEANEPTQEQHGLEERIARLESALAKIVQKLEGDKEKEEEEASGAPKTAVNTNETQPMGTYPSPAVEGLEKAIHALRERVDALAAEPAATAPEPLLQTRAADASARLDALNERVAAANERSDYAQAAELIRAYYAPQA